ncbi:MAG: hypothetical protein ACK58L_00545 [Planctomycetota bacterium]
MLNPSRLNAACIHQRLSRHVSAITVERRKSAVQVLTGSSRVDTSIIEAVGYDLLISTRDQLSPGQCVAVAFRSDIARSDITIPGTVHWVNSRVGSFESAVVLQDVIPDHLIARSAGGVQRGIRFGCHVEGTLSWGCSDGQSIVDGLVSLPAIATNYSRGGFCVRLSTEPEIGAEVAFGWQNGRSSHRLQGVVRWVIGQFGGAMAGCETLGAKGYLLGGVDV